MPDLLFIERIKLILYKYCKSSLKYLYMHFIALSQLFYI